MPGNGSLIVRGDIELNGFDLVVSGRGVVQFDGAINGDGGLITKDGIEVVLNAANGYTGQTVVSELSGLRIRNSQALGSVENGTVLRDSSSLVLENDVTVIKEPLSGSIRLFSQGNNSWMASIITSSPMIVGATFGRGLQFNDITTPYLQATGGHVSLKGTVTASMGASVTGGTLEVDGTLGIGSMEVIGSLSGVGSVELLDARNALSIYGTVSPGSLTGPGTLRTASITFSRQASLRVRLYGPAVGGQYDQLQVAGRIQIDATNLRIDLGNAPVIAGTEYMIVNNDGLEPVTGTFLGLGERELFAIGSRLFRISYTGGDGNDIVVTAVVGDQLPPTDISLNNITMAENSTIGTIVGTFSSIDPNGAGAFTYEILGQGPRFLVDYNDLDGPRWTGVIDTNTNDLTGNLPFGASSAWPAVRLIRRDTMIGSTYDVQEVDIPDDWSGDMYQDPIVFWFGSLGSDDYRNYYGGWGAGYSWDQDVSDIQTGPVGLVWPTTIEDGWFVRTKVSVSQPDILTVTRVDPERAFRIVGNQLIVNSPLDYESKSSHTIRIQSTDAGGLSFEKTFVINVTDVNEAPSDIQLTTTIVPENANANESLATLATTDQDGDDTFNYSLVGGAGGDDNDLFVIVGQELFAQTSFDFESKNSYSIRIRSTDAGGLFVERALSIAVSDVNEPPSAMNLSNASVPENAGAGALVGTLSATDPDRTDLFSYTVLSGPGSDDNASFQLVGSELRTLVNFDYETKNAYSVRIRLTDAAGYALEKVFSISVTDELDFIAQPGDTNRDGVFNSTDLIFAFQAGEYEDNRVDNSVWADGDWNGDGEFDSSDIVFAFQRSVYVHDAVFGAIAARDDLS